MNAFLVTLLASRPARNASLLEVSVWICEVGAWRGPADTSSVLVIASIVQVGCCAGYHAGPGSPHVHSKREIIRELHPESYHWGSYYHSTSGTD